MVEGLASADLLEEGRRERLLERDVVHVVGGEVREDAGLDPALVVDVDVVLAGNAAVDVRRVTPEIDREQCFGVAHALDAKPELVALGGSEHETHVGVDADRHVEEVPADHGALGDHLIGELVAHQILPVVARHGGRIAEDHAALSQPVHGDHDLVEHAGAASCVGLLARTLDAEHRGDVAESREAIKGRLVEQRAVRVDMEVHVGVGGVEVEQILTKEGLAAENGDEVHTHLVGLIDDALQRRHIHVAPARVLAGKAAVAGEVAAHGRADEDGERRGHALALAERGALGRAPEHGIDDEALDETVARSRAQLPDDVARDVQCRMIVDDLVAHEQDLGLVVFWRELFGEVEGLDDLGLVVAGRQLQDLIDRAPLNGGVETIGGTHRVATPLGQIPRASLPSYQPLTAGSDV